MKLMRGAKPSPRHRLAAATPHVGALPPPSQLLWLPRQLSMWGNATYGDCTVAEEAFAKATSAPEIFIPDDVVIAWAEANGAIDGDTLIDVLDKMQTIGFDQDGHKYLDGAPLSVNWFDRQGLMAAIAQGPVKIAVAADQLESTIQKLSVFPHNGWFATGYTLDVKLDHCTSLCGYGPVPWLAAQMGVPVPAGVDGATFAFAMFTWGSVGIIDEPSMLAITGEAWVRTPTTIIK